MKRKFAGVLAALGMVATLLLVAAPASSAPVYPGTVTTSCKWSSVVDRQLVRGQFIGVRSWARAAGNARPTGWIKVSAVRAGGPRFIRVLPYSGLGQKVLLGRIHKGGFYHIRMYYSPDRNSVYKPCAFVSTVAVHNR